MEQRSKAISLIAAGLLITALIGLIPLLAPELMLGARAIPTLLLIVVISIITVLSILKATRETDGYEKRKRSAEEMNRFAVIRQLVADLDRDERDYLRHLLNEEDAEPTQNLSRLLEAEPAEVGQGEAKRR